LNDIYATHEFNKNYKSRAIWDPIAVIPEFSFLNKEYEHGDDPKLLPHNEQMWGGPTASKLPAYFYDDHCANFDPETKKYKTGRGTVFNFFLLETAKYSRYAVAFVKNIDSLMVTDIKEKKGEKEDEYEINVVNP
jgi:hypothetical protein